MPQAQPIACSLSSAELTLRLAQMSAVGSDALISSKREGQIAVLSFHLDDMTQQRLAAIVAAESKCCAFLAMDLRQEGATLTLTIRAPAGAEPVLDELIAGFTRTEVSA